MICKDFSAVRELWRSYFLPIFVNQQPKEPSDRPSPSGQDGSISNAGANSSANSSGSGLSRMGTIAAALVTTFFLGAWVARGVVERKTPSFFEVAFASLSAVTALADPKAAPVLLTKLLNKSPD